MGSFFYGSMQKSVRSALSDLHAFARRKLLQMRCAAYALQAGCRQFDPVIAHQQKRNSQRWVPFLDLVVMAQPFERICLLWHFLSKGFFYEKEKIISYA